MASQRWPEQSPPEVPDPRIRVAIYSAIGAGALSLLGYLGGGEPAAVAGGVFGAMIGAYLAVRS